jgi:hypothetical protein
MVFAIRYHLHVQCVIDLESQQARFDAVAGDWLAVCQKGPAQQLAILINVESGGKKNLTHYLTPLGYGDK